MTTRQWHMGLVRDLISFPILWRPTEPLQPTRLLAAEDRAVTALLTACELLARRGPDPQGWTTPFRKNPIAFLLDTMNTAVNLWGPDGVLIYSNRAAEQIGLDHRDEMVPEESARDGSGYERRCVRLEYDGEDYVLEIVQEFRGRDRRG